MGKHRTKRQRRASCRKKALRYLLKYDKYGRIEQSGMKFAEAVAAALLACIDNDDSIDYDAEPCERIREAADTITQQAREIERLRFALSSIVLNVTNNPEFMRETAQAALSPTRTAEG